MKKTMDIAAFGLDDSVLEKCRCILEEFGLEEAVAEFEIPQRWHDDQSVYELDSLQLRAQTKSRLKYKKFSVKGDDLEPIDVKQLIYDCIWKHVKFCCFDVPAFIYQVFIYTKKITQEYNQYLEGYKSEYDSEIAAEEESAWQAYL